MMKDDGSNNCETEAITDIIRARASDYDKDWYKIAKARQEAIYDGKISKLR